MKNIITVVTNKQKVLAIFIHVSDFFSSNVDGEAKEIVKQVVPKFNSIVIFKVTPESWHQVSEILSDVQRFSLTGWYHG